MSSLLSALLISSFSKALVNRALQGLGSIPVSGTSHFLHVTHTQARATRVFCFLRGLLCASSAQGHHGRRRSEEITQPCCELHQPAPGTGLVATWLKRAQPTKLAQLFVAFCQEQLGAGAQESG